MSCFALWEFEISWKQKPNLMRTFEKRRSWMFDRNTPNKKSFKGLPYMNYSSYKKLIM